MNKLFGNQRYKGRALALGRYVSDLEPGDQLEAMEIVISENMVRQYCHAVELHHECFQGGASYAFAPPSIMHLIKVMILSKNCPKGAGPNARLHYSFSVKALRKVRPGEIVIASGFVERRYTKREREYIDTIFELHSEKAGELLMSYKDASLLSFAKKGAE